MVRCLRDAAFMCCLGEAGCSGRLGCGVLRFRMMVMPSACSKLLSLRASKTYKPNPDAER